MGINTESAAVSATEQVEQEASQLGRRLYPDEVAAMAVFLAGDGAGAVNGQSINVCGGICYA